MKKKYLLLALVMIVAALMVGCNENTQPIESETPEATVEAAETTDAETEQPEASQEKEEEVVLEPMIFGVAYSKAATTTELYSNFFDNFVGPAFNVEFVYMEPSQDVGVELSFIENLATMGGSALIDFSVKYGDEAEAVVAKCNEYGIYYIANNGDSTESLHNYEYFGGLAASRADVTALQFKEMVEKVFGDGEQYNIAMMNALTQTEGAHYSQHGQTNMTMLATFAELFGWTYKYDDLWDICTINAMTDVDTGTEQILRMVPSFKPDDMYQAIKNGDINGIVSSGPAYTFYESIVSDVEKQYDMDIKQISIAAITDTTLNSFEVGSLDAALLKNSTICGSLFIEAYNCVTGHPELARDVNDPNGEYYVLDASMWVCYDVDTYNKLSQIDVIGGEYYSWTIDEIKSALYIYNNDVTHADIVEIAKQAGIAENVLEKNGLS